MNFRYKDRTYHITRYPKSANRSLRAWSAADEHILRHLEETDLDTSKLAIYHDRFGFLTCMLNVYSPLSIRTFKSQEKAIIQNLKANRLDASKVRFISPLESLPEPVDLALVKIPKSTDLFRFYLYHFSRHLKPEGEVVCAFMTRHFGPQLLTIAGEFFDSVEQSRAWKKSRFLLLKNKKPFQEQPMLSTVKLDETISLQQYPGVFSADHIDYASQFLIEHLQLREQDQQILDLGAGNGVLAAVIRQRLPECEIHVLDDSILAIESARLNLQGEHVHFHFNDCLEEFEDKSLDFVVSNPPFHFEHENNIEVSLALFQQVHRCLKADGRFQLVANRHLNYKTHLVRIFSKVEILAENEKFVIYACAQ